MLTTPTRSLCCATLALAARLASAQSAPDSGGATRSVQDGAYTAVQAGRGETQFREICAQCHATSQFTGTSFIRSWGARSAFDLFDLIRQSMPFDSPGGLSRETYADVVAFIFRLNGFPAGDRELPTDDAALKRVRIDPPRAP